MLSTMIRNKVLSKLGASHVRSQQCYRSVWPWVFVAISAINALGVTLAAHSPWPGLHLPCVLGASTSFVLVAIAAGGLHSRYGRFILAGLVACWCGDVLGAQYFLTGVFAFCLAHAAFISAFVTKGIIWKRLVAAVVPVVIALVVILRWLLPHVQQPEEVVAVCAYATVISTMVLAAFGASEGPRGRLILSGALIIYISDIFVAGWRYGDFGSSIGRFCYPLYYSACLLFALSVFAERPKAE